MSQFIADNGELAASLAVTLFSAVMSRYLWNRLKANGAQQLLQRAYAEIMDAVLLVSQTYVSEIKKHSADGTLTEAERAEARRRAVLVVMQNLGDTGLDRLARVLGFKPTGGGAPVLGVTEWIAQKTEVTIGALKSGAVQRPGSSLAMPGHDPAERRLPISSMRHDGGTSYAHNASK